MKLTTVSTQGIFCSEIMTIIQKYTLTSSGLGVHVLLTQVIKSNNYLHYLSSSDILLTLRKYDFGINITNKHTPEYKTFLTEICK